MKYYWVTELKIKRGGRKLSRWTAASEIKGLQLCNTKDTIDLLGAINEVFQPQNILNLSNQTLIQILLYGDGKCTQNQNRNILESALKFIHTSERFL